MSQKPVGASESKVWAQLSPCPPSSACPSQLRQVVSEAQQQIAAAEEPQDVAVAEVEVSGMEVGEKNQGFRCWDSEDQWRIVV